MSESKTETYDRLRAAGQWPEACVWKDAKIKELRASGMKKLDAREEAWRLLATKYLPVLAEPDEEPANRPITHGDLDKWLKTAVEYEVQKCLKRYAVTLCADAMEDLVTTVVAFCCVMEDRYWPGPRYRQDDQWLYDPLSEPEPASTSPLSVVSE